MSEQLEALCPICGTRHSDNLNEAAVYKFPIFEDGSCKAGFQLCAEHAHLESPDTFIIVITNDEKFTGRSFSVDKQSFEVIFSDDYPKSFQNTYCVELSDLIEANLINEEHYNEKPTIH